VKNALGYDDSLDVFGIHGVAGILGSIGTGIFYSPALGAWGPEDFSMASQVWIQIVAVLITIALVRDRLAHPLQGRGRAGRACAWPPTPSAKASTSPSMASGLT
jgi:hypothetical protein